MSSIAIRVEGLGKKFRIGSNQPYHRLSELFVGLGTGAANRCKSFFSREKLQSAQKEQSGNSNEFWALRDINFEVEQGEVLGIIGRNGAGKSTLLKVLSRITEPTEGRFGVRGRLGSLLEVGTGFHPELTGRENIYLSGCVLGMNRAEIRKKFDEIVEFSGVEKFLETPVKRYSSGMQVRLGFAVAAHLEPEILIVDEVLAVGDAEFQKKCLGKMGDVANSGRTILFVSHNLAAVRKLCHKAIILEGGQMTTLCETSAAIGRYLKQSHTRGHIEFDVAQREFSTYGVRLLNACAVSEQGNVQDLPSFGRSRNLLINVSYERESYTGPLDVTLVFRSPDNEIEFVTSTIHTAHEQTGTQKLGVYNARCHLDGGLLSADTHSIDVMLIVDRSLIAINQPSALVIELVEDQPSVSRWAGRRPGVVWPTFHWEVA